MVGEAYNEVCTTHGTHIRYTSIISCGPLRNPQQKWWMASAGNYTHSLSLTPSSLSFFYISIFDLQPLRSPFPSLMSFNVNSLSCPFPISPQLISTYCSSSPLSISPHLFVFPTPPSSSFPSCHDTHHYPQPLFPSLPLLAALSFYSLIFLRWALHIVLYQASTGFTILLSVSLSLPHCSSGLCFSNYNHRITVW